MLVVHLVHRDLELRTQLCDTLAERCDLALLVASTRGDEDHPGHLIGEHRVLQLEQSYQGSRGTTQLLAERRRRLLRLHGHRHLLHDAVQALHVRKRVVERVDELRAGTGQLWSGHPHSNRYLTLSILLFGLYSRPTFPCGLPSTRTMSAVKSKRPPKREE